MIYSNEKFLSVMTLNLIRKPKFKKCPIRVAEWSTSIGPSRGLQGSYIDPTEDLPRPNRGPLHWPFVGSLHGAFEGEHVKTMLALHSLPSWGQHNKGANYVGPSGAQLKISTRECALVVIITYIGFSN